MRLLAFYIGVVLLSFCGWFKIPLRQDSWLRPHNLVKLRPTGKPPHIEIRIIYPK